MEIRSAKNGEVTLGGFAPKKILVQAIRLFRQIKKTNNLNRMKHEVQSIDWEE